MAALLKTDVENRYHNTRINTSISLARVIWTRPQQVTEFCLPTLQTTITYIQDKQTSHSNLASHSLVYFIKQLTLKNLHIILTENCEEGF